MFRDIIKGLKQWLISTRKVSINFISALIAAYALFSLSVALGWPEQVTLLAMFSTLIIPFGMITMLATSNPIYEKLYSSHWGKAVLGVLGTVYFGFSYVWAAGEVNRIFEEAPGNLPWTISVLTAVYFFKNVVLFFSGALLFIATIYSTYWIWDVLVINYKSITLLLKRIVLAVSFIFSLGLISGAASFVTVKSDEIARLIAVNADFSSKHRCKGQNFDDAKGVLFLTSGDVLIAKYSANSGSGVWTFPKDKCAIYFLPK